MKKQISKKHLRREENPLIGRPAASVSGFRRWSLTYALPLLILLSVGVIAYWNSFDAPFVFDDMDTIETNSAVQFGDALTRVPAALWARTLLFITFAANHAVNGQNVWGYHLVNLLLHVLNGALIYVIGKHIFSSAFVRRDLSGSFAISAAVFFLVHPVQTESVTYISSRSELLSTLFYMLALLLFVRRRPEKIDFRFALVIAATLAIAISAKETAISIPAALLVYDFVFLSGGEIRRLSSRWSFHAPFILGGLAAAFYLAVFGSLRNSIGSSVSRLTSYSYFLTELRVIVRYLRLMVLPAGLNLSYDFRRSDSFLEPSVLFSALLLLVLLCLAWRLRQRSPVLAFSILWFFVTLAPTSSIMPIPDVIFEHRLYLPMAGICLSFPLLVEYAQSFLNARLRLRWSALPIGSALVIALMLGTILRNQVWRDEMRLWADVIQKSPRIARGYVGLAGAYYKRGDYEKAIEISKQGLSSAKDSALTFYGNIGQFYLEHGRYDEAIEALSKALEKTNTPAEKAGAYYNIAAAYLAQSSSLTPNDSRVAAGQLQERKEALLAQAEEALLKSLESDRSHLQAWDSYINLSVERGRQESLRAQLRERAQENPRNALYGLGKLAFQEGNYSEAVRYFQQAAKFFENQKVFYFNYAYALEETGDVEGAIDEYTKAIQVDPLFMQARYNLGQLYLGKGQDQRAIEHFSQILRFDANNMLVHLQLARIYIRSGQMAAARNHLNAVLSVSPGNPEATALWKQTL